MRRFQPERSFYIPKAAVEIVDAQSDALAFTYETAGALYALGFCGKRQRPDWHFRFGTAERRAEHIERYFTGRRSSAARKMQAREQERAQRARPHGIEIGHVFVSSWGYEQTNVDFYQVTALNGRSMLTARKIASIDAGQTGSMAGKCVPAADQFIGEPKRYAIRRGRIRVSSCAIAELWDGRPRYWSSYA